MSCGAYNVMIGVECRSARGHVGEHDFGQSEPVGFVISDEEVEAGLLMTNDGMPMDKVGLMLAACRKSGRDPMELARHMVKLRSYAKGL